MSGLNKSFPFSYLDKFLDFNFMDFRMKPDGLLKEYMSSLVSGCRLIFLLVVSSVIAGRLERVFGFKNPIAYFLILAAAYLLLEGLLGLFGQRGKKKKKKELQRGGYD